MRSQLVVLAAWLCAALVWIAKAAPPADGERALAFSDGDQTELGEVPMGKHVARFFVRNAANWPVRIGKVSASCTCMQIQFDQSPLGPGEERECVVDINVQSGGQKSTAVIFDVEAPRSQRIVKVLSYIGRQQDRLDIEVDPPQLVVVAGDVRKVTMECCWRSSSAIGPDEPIALSIRNARGVKLLAEEPLSRSDYELRWRFTLELDARTLDRVKAELDFAAGRPVRAEQNGNLDFAVSPSLVLRPGSLVIEGEVPHTGVDIGRVDIDLADGWSVARVDAPAWLATQVEGDTLRIALADAPPFRRGIGEIEVNATNSSGVNVTRKLKCIFDVREQ